MLGVPENHGIIYAIILYGTGAIIIAMLVRAIASWFRIDERYAFIRFLARLTDPFIVPIRRIMVDAMRVSVRVIPRSSKNTLEWEDRALKVRLTAPPVDGAANEALLILLAQRLDLPKRDIQIVQGAAGRHKIVEIAGMTLEELEQKIRG